MKRRPPNLKNFFAMKLLKNLKRVNFEYKREFRFAKKKGNK